MLRLLLLPILCLTTGVMAQAFHFNNTSTTLVKTTDQSPAHWYIEIYNDAGVDTTLRWKASFVNVPAQWNVNFDDQNTLYSTVNDGDSADFTLFSGLSFPQKLIIGADFNGVPGNASIFFDIYDPANPSYVVTIEYHYIVTLAGLEEFGQKTMITRNGNTLSFDESMIGGTVQILDVSGAVLEERSITKTLTFDEFKSGGLFLIRVISDDRNFLRREFVTAF